MSETTTTAATETTAIDSTDSGTPPEESVGVDAARVRAYCSLPAEVSDELLDAHLATARAQLEAKLGGAVLDEAGQARADEALCALTYASALPYLNTFALSGASRVAKLVQDTDMDLRFFDSEDMRQLQSRLRQEAQELINLALATASGTTTNDSSLQAGNLYIAAL